jgi:hypothetical protein
MFSSIDFTNPGLKTILDVSHQRKYILSAEDFLGCIIEGHLRAAATDIIYDVEKEQVIYAEFLKDGYMAYQQFFRKLSCDRGLSVHQARTGVPVIPREVGSKCRE